MDYMTYILFICIAAPMLLMLIPIEKGSRKVILCMLTGMFCCLFISETNGFFLKLSGFDLLYFTTNITPITEEIIKFIPVLLYALLFSDKRKDVITAAFSIGVGFAMIENLIVLTQNINSADIGFAIIRGFCSGLMHSICTISISYFIPFIKKKKKFFVAGIIMTLNLAIVYHSVYNLLVQSVNPVTIHIGFFMPISTYIIINLNLFFKRKQHEKKI